MIRAAVLYWVVASAALIAGIGVPYLVHRSGSAAVPQWQEMVAPGGLSAKHRFLDRQCETCHAPHDGVTAKKCIVCHTDVARLTAKQSTRFHFQIGECRGCHIEHNGAERRPIAMDHSALASAGLSNLTPQGSALTRLRDFLSDLSVGVAERQLAALDCAACHSNRDRHRGQFGRACSACHSDNSWKVTGFRHPAPDSTQCAQCHQAPPSHYMEHFAMVSAKVARQEHARVEQCFLCHSTDAWNNIRDVGWYKHH